TNFSTGAAATCSVSGQTVTCAIGAITSGGGFDYSIVARPPATAGEVTASVSISGAEPDPNTANNAATEQTSVTRAASDLRIENLSASPNPVTLNTGQTVTYSASIFNSGPSAASGVVITDTLPAGVTFISASSSQGTCSRSGNTVTCNVGTVGVSGRVSVTLLTLPNTFGDLTNSVSVTSSEPDSNTANNSSSIVTTVNGRPSINGRIAEANGNGVGGVTVTLSGPVSRVIQTNPDGTYFFPNLTPGGDYTVIPTSTNFTFIPVRADFPNLNSNPRADFLATPQPSPTPTPAPSDDFSGNQRDPERFNLGTLTQPEGAFDPQVPVVQRNGQLQITPRAGVSNSFNGYVTVRAFDLTGGTAGVEVPQVATGGAQSVFGVGSDSDNFYRFVVGMSSNLVPAGAAKQSLDRVGPNEAAMQVLVFQVKINGVVTQQVIPYDMAQHRYWRFRHEAAVNSILFETSPDNVAFTERHRVALQKGVSALAAELSAGTATPTNSGGTTAFDNFSVVTSSMMQFSAATFNVGETDGRATITVTRTGNISGAATISYATVDNPAAIRCDDTTTLPGVAFARCDYTTSVDTLSFAANETTKTFAISIIDDSFFEGPETFQLVLSNPASGAVGAQGTATVAITDNDSSGDVPNPIYASREFFVRQQYLDFLSREPETDGFQSWLRVLSNCPNVDAPPESPAMFNGSPCDRIFVSGEGFFRSPEFELKGLYVYLFYRASFGYRVSQGLVLPAYSEIVADLSAVTGQTTADLHQRRAAFAEAFTRRPEFVAAYGGLSDQAFVDTLLGRYTLTQITTEDPANPDATGQVTLTRQQLVAQLAGRTLTRGQALRAVVQSSEVTAREFNEAFVAMQYYGYLRRTPEEAGYQMWLRVINNQQNGVRVMINGFLNSPEYQLRFGRVER
ncbi:MAG: Calx-beta domain-containing protein, partial [Pyrinomonadaceae bacterium]